MIITIKVIFIIKIELCNNISTNNKNAVLKCITNSYLQMWFKHVQFIIMV